MDSFFKNIDLFTFKKASSQLDRIPASDAALERLERTTLSSTILARLQRTATRATFSYVEAVNRKRIIHAAKNLTDVTDFLSRTSEMNQDLESVYYELAVNRESDSDDTLLDKLLQAVANDRHALVYTPEDLEAKVEELEALDEEDIEGRLVYARSAVSFYISQSVPAFMVEIHKQRLAESLSTPEDQSQDDSETDESTEPESVDPETPDTISDVESDAYEEADGFTDSAEDLPVSEDASPAVLSTEPPSVDLEASEKASDAENDASEGVSGHIDSPLDLSDSENASPAALPTEPVSVDLDLPGNVAGTQSDACDEAGELTSSPMDPATFAEPLPASPLTSEAYALAKSAKKKEKRARQKAQRMAAQVKEEKVLVEEETLMEKETPGEEKSPMEESSTAEVEISTGEEIVVKQEATLEEETELPIEDALPELDDGAAEENAPAGACFPAEGNIQTKQQMETEDENSTSRAATEEHAASTAATASSLSDAKPQVLSRAEKKKQKREGQKARKLAARVKTEEVTAKKGTAVENEDLSAAWEAPEQLYAALIRGLGLRKQSPAQVMWLAAMVIGVLVLLWASIMRIS